MNHVYRRYMCIDLTVSRLSSTSSASVLGKRSRAAESDSTFLNLI